MSTICNSTVTINIVPGIPRLFRVVCISEDYDLTYGDDVIDVDTSAGNVTITVHRLINRGFRVRKIDSSENTVIVDGDGFNINGFPTRVISSQYVSEFFIGGDFEWEVN